jgi:hypothetical protein
MSTDAARWITEWNEGVMREAREKAQAEFEQRIKEQKVEVQHPRLDI